ncbi:MAG: DUF1599 domain-containing protein [Bacteroidia bacterium]|nr:DUF1599 domain-containing protein [Bacteroidia bacterium]
MVKTGVQYDEQVRACKNIFVKKMKDYGSAWRVLRTGSITDQIFIKANRIKNIEVKGMQRVEEDVRSEYIGIVNYSVIGLIQLAMADDPRMEISAEEGGKLFDKYIGLAKSLMENKNHDYGEAWREMRVSSLTDLLLMKIHRMKQIEDNDGKTMISEGLDANYMDMINYSLFALIRLSE